MAITAANGIETATAQSASQTGVSIDNTAFRRNQGFDLAYFQAQLQGQGQKLDIGEIAGMDLTDVRMVTLSACETALGEDPSSQGELTTLADAFGFAGCPTVTASLWQVSDDSTKVLMETYYRELKGGAAPAAAMQTAQKTLIANEDTRHPYHWAPFLLIGDWR